MKAKIIKMLKKMSTQNVKDATNNQQLEKMDSVINALRI